MSHFKTNDIEKCEERWMRDGRNEGRQEEKETMERGKESLFPRNEAIKKGNRRSNFLLFFWILTYTCHCFYNATDV